MNVPNHGEWAIKPGDIAHREQLAGVYGGGKQGGVEPSRTSPNVLLFSDPARGENFGYSYDGWNEDRTIFMYTGHGQRGAQSLDGRNGSVLRHRKDGRALRLFVAAGRAQGRTRAVNQLYLGQFEIDQAEPKAEADAPDVDGEIRTVVVFRLRPVGDVLRREEDISPTGGVRDAASTDLVPAGDPPRGSATAVALEAAATLGFPVSSRLGTSAFRREAELVARFSEHLKGLDHECFRHRLRPPGELRDLVTDLFDATDGILYEAKGSATREDVRLALGQLLDYRRHINPMPAVAVLLPRRPTADLCDLLRQNGVRCTYESDGGGFLHVE